jgi:hypothetical protein
VLSEIGAADLTPKVRDELLSVLSTCVGHPSDPATRATYALAHIAPRIVSPIGATRAGDEARMAARWRGLVAVWNAVAALAGQEQGGINEPGAGIACLPQVRPIPPDLEWPPVRDQYGRPI